MQNISGDCFPCLFVCLYQCLWHLMSTDLGIAIGIAIMLPLSLDRVLLCDGHHVSAVNQADVGRHCCSSRVTTLQFSLISAFCLSFLICLTHHQAVPTSTGTSSYTFSRCLSIPHTSSLLTFSNQELDDCFKHTSNSGFLERTVVLPSVEWNCCHY
jgi:hypothetical protein